MSMSVTILVGRLGRDPESRQSKTGTSVCMFSIATDSYNSLENKKETIWHNILVFGPQADNCMRFLKKGSMVGVTGEQKLDEYTAKDGTKRASLKMIANHVNFFFNRGENGQGTKSTEEKESRRADFGAGSDDIPF